MANSHQRKPNGSEGNLCKYSTTMMTYISMEENKSVRTAFVFVIQYFCYTSTISVKTFYQTYKIKICLL